MMRSKKGVAVIIIGVIFFLVSLSIVFVPRISGVERDNFIGEAQYELLASSKEAQAIQLYVSQAANYAANDALQSLSDNAGYYLNKNEQGIQVDYPCDTFLYPIYSVNNGCLPDLEANYQNHFIETLQPHRERYAEEIISLQKDLGKLSVQKLESERSIVPPINFDMVAEGSDTKIVGETSREIPLPVGDSAPSSVHVDADLGSYGNEKITVCGSGECFASIAERFYQRYTSTNTALDYVFGGESPYTYENAHALSQIKGSFLDGVTVSHTEPGSNKLTVPGFDCSGWLYWVGKHSGIHDFRSRLTTGDYLSRARNGDAEMICDQNTLSCDRELILEKAQPGDVIYVARNSKIDHVAIYMGDGTIIHSKKSTGLIKELLPSAYTNSNQYSVIAVYRHKYAEDGKKIINKKKENAKQEKISLIGPTSWCSSNTKTISATYEKRVNADAIGVDASIKDIIIQAALQKGLDPALIATHAQLESSVNKERTCYPKSQLTGCGWNSAVCAKNCNCDNSFVINDLTQVQCTAATDFNAFNEALSGDADLSTGQYEKCNSYANDPEKMWSCILCIYQGNYDTDVKGDNLIFTRDGTCAYAERFEDEYCKWRNYFDEQGYKVDAVVTDGTIQRGAKLSFSPKINVESPVKSGEFDKKTAFIEDVSESCTDDLGTCLNTKLPKNIRTANLEPEEDIATQLLGCTHNGQSNCYCNIMIPKTSKPLIIHLEQNGELYKDTWRTGLPFGGKDTRKVAEVASNMAFVKSSPVKEHEYIQLYLAPDKQQYFEAEGIVDDRTWDLNDSIALYKSEDEFVWMAPEYEMNSSVMCRKNPRYFPLTASFDNDVSFDFTLELNDSTAPKLLATSTETVQCTQPAVVVEWSIKSQNETPFGHTIGFEGHDETFFFYDSDAVEAKNYPSAGVLDKEDKSGVTRYRTLLSTFPDFQPLTPGKIVIKVQDHYFNTNVSESLVYNTTITSTTRSLTGRTKCIPEELRILQKGQDQPSSREKLDIPLASLGSSEAICGLTQRNSARLKYVLAQRESNHNYYAENSLGYIGKYQFGAPALADTGLVKLSALENARRFSKWQVAFLNNDQNWKLKGGKKTFFESAKIQEDAMDALLGQNCKILQNNGVLFSVSNQEQIAGYLAASHIGGAGNAIKLANNPNYDFSDAYGTDIQEYYQLGVDAVITAPRVQREPYLDENQAPLIDPNGEQVYKIDNIAQVVCDESNSVYKKICGASSDVVSKLHEMSPYLAENNFTLVVNQAYRTYDIQRYFWDQYQQNNGPAACNPDNFCKHMISQAIDVTLVDSNTGQRVSDAVREDTLCRFGFVRFSGEQWHYEYGTARWERAEKMRARGENVCSL